MSVRHIALALSGVACLAAVGCSSNASNSTQGVTASSATPTATQSAGAAFVSRIDNPYFPLLPGARYVYDGIKDGKKAHEILTVTSQTEVVDGVTCVVLKDNLYLAGKLAERTTDWYAQDTVGNVWYYGEDTVTFNAQGKVESTDGTWRAGRAGARPGIFMPIQPEVGRSYQQEYYKGQAEDHFRILNLSAPVHVPAVTATTGILTEEWTPLEPGVLDHKYYVRGVGTVLEKSVKGDPESLTLVTFTPGS
ncbi:MAG: hypothetical protein QOG53_2111 [Frankiales bacterium]|jgi:hypothetical protein|nr:hypothetical protein [Frankiales bacterium]